MCCGQKRTELRNSQAQRTTPSAPPNRAGNSRVQAVRTQTPVPPATGNVSPVNAHIGSVPPQTWTTALAQYWHLKRPV
jgi:hypothetical protein